MRESGNQGIRESGYRGISLCFLGLLILLCHSCDTASKPIAIETEQPETKPAAEEQKPKEQPVVKTPAEAGVNLNIVAKIGDYVITREELEKRIISELQPDYRQYQKQAEPVNAKTVLLKMIAEKAMVMDARRLNYLEDERIQASLKRFEQSELARLLLAGHLKGKITVTEAEIDKKIKTNPKLSRAQAKTMLGRAKANSRLSQYYRELYETLHVQKVSRNFAGAVQIHRRLLYRPKTPRRVKWIQNAQIRDELTPEEKNIVLATYDNGKVTLKDWFDALCDIGPASRPRDLHTLQGVEQLLDSILRMPIFVAKAKLLGLDKDENLLKQIKEREDTHLFNKARSEKVKALSDPNEKELIDYFEKNKEAFGTRKALKIEQIWCQDLKAARKVKAELDSGKDFEAVRQKYSLQKKAVPFNTSSQSEGIFFEDLWKGEPNEIVGPAKGFYREQIKWRIVKILEKTPGKVKEYSSSMKEDIETKMWDEQRSAILKNYRKELLEKYPHEIYAERLRDIDPLDIP